MEGTAAGKQLEAARSWNVVGATITTNPGSDGHVGNSPLVLTE
jgi:hypothetical protein